MHEPECYRGVFGTAAQAGNVIDDKHGGPNQVYFIFNGGNEQVVFVDIGRRVGYEIILCTEKIIRKQVILVALAVPQPKLRLAQLEIDVEHTGGRRLAGEICNTLPVRDAFANLHGQHRFAGIGIGKQHT